MNQSNEARFHRAISKLFNKKEQGYIMGAYREVHSEQLVLELAEVRRMHAAGEPVPLDALVKWQCETPAMELQPFPQLNWGEDEPWPRWRHVKPITREDEGANWLLRNDGAKLDWSGM